MKVNVLGKPYVVIETTFDLSGGDMLGCTNRSKQLIVVRKDAIGEDQYLETLLHETLHIVSEELALNLREEDIARLAVGLYSAGCRIKVEK